MDKKIFASNIKTLRRIQNITQEELAARIGVGRPRVGSWEEQRAWPAVPDLLRLSNYFRVDINRLLTEKLN